MTLALRYAVRSDVGLLREGNEDSAYAGPHLLAVADGMGGYEAGEVASAAVISTVAPLDRREMPESELTEALAAAVTSAKQTLRRIVEADPAVGSMGTTLTAMLWSGGAAAICHIGDSRAYLLRDGDLYQITRDHTFVQALIEQGRIRPEEAATHPQRSLLLRALDGRTDADPDLSMLEAMAGDRYLICSDGLPVAVSDDAIVQALAEAAEPADAVLKLIDLAIAGGAPDNVTCIVADVVDTDDPHVRPTRAPVLAGAAAASGEIPDKTRPFARPVVDGEAGLTHVGLLPDAAGRGDTIPAGRASGERERVTVPGRTQSAARPGAGPGAGPAQAAATIATGADPAGEDDGDLRPRRRARRRWPLVTSILVLFVLVIGGGLFALLQYAHSQYYVGTHAGKVVIFRGLNQRLFGLNLSSVYDPAGIPVSGVPASDLAAIGRAPTGSLAQAQSFLANIRRDYQSCQSAYAAVRTWEANKPKPVRKTFKVNGKTVTRTVTPHYRPEPKIPAGCPPMPISGASSP